MQTLWREPLTLAAGDTLAFSRQLPDYPATDGWSMLYTISGNNAPPLQFQSVASGSAHSLSVPAGTTAQLLPGDYVLTGYAIKGDERYQVYYGALTVTENTVTEQVQKTFAQQMVEKLEAVMLGAADDNLLESRIGETLFKYLSPEQLRAEHGYWKTVRRQEIAMERARAGLPTGNKIRPVLRVKPIQPSVGMFGRGTGYGGW